MNISNRLNRILQYAYADIKKRKNRFLTLEHIFYGMLKNNTMISHFKAMGADTDYLIMMMKKYLDRYQESYENLPKDFQPLETDAFQRTTNRMFEHIQGIRKDVADELDFLVAMSEEKQSFVMQLLHKFNIEKYDIVEYVANLKREQEQDKKTKNEIEKYATEIVAEAINYDNVIGRETEIERVMEILARRKKNNPILVGVAGVG